MTELVFSGIQPTGNLHLGNYLGAIKQWIDIQNKYRSIFCIVDMHAITVPQDPEALRKSTMELAAVYIASGIDPKKSIIFPQSAVSGHAELAWILGCNTPMGWLNRMTQFKDKAQAADSNSEAFNNAKLGLFGYPVLMAADILLYNATHVPVGEDQKQHLELARDIANSFNFNYKKQIKNLKSDAAFREGKPKDGFFHQPEPLILKEGARIMSLNDGTRKMSKSEESDYSRINLSDDEAAIRNKCLKAKSDSIAEIYYDKEARPDISNLLTIYATLRGITIEAAVEGFKGRKTSELKSALADALIEELNPIRNEFKKLMGDTAHLNNVLRDGAEKANEIAAKNLKQVKEVVGFFV